MLSLSSSERPRCERTRYADSNASSSAADESPPGTAAYCERPEPWSARAGLARRIRYASPAPARHMKHSSEPTTATPASGADSAWAAKGGDAFHDYLCRKSTKAYTDGVLDLCVDDDDEGGTTRGTQKRDTLPMVYLGPDEQIVPKDINWVVANAARRGHPTPDAFMSSKRGSKRVIHRRFNVGVLEATPGRTTLRVRPER